MAKNLNLHKYYSVNIFAYLVVLSSLILFTALILLYGFKNTVDALIIGTLYEIIVEYLLPLNFVFIVIEFIFRKTGVLVRGLNVVLPKRYLNIVYAFLFILIFVNTIYFLYCLLQNSRNLIYD